MNQRTIASGLLLAGIACFLASRIQSVAETWFNVVLNFAGLLLVGIGLYRVWKIGRQAGA